MRYLFTFLITFSFSVMLSAQNAGGCGTVRPADYEHNLSVEERSIVHSAPSSQRAGTRWVGVWYHIITKDDGTGGANLKDVFISHCELNEYYNVFDIGFFIQGIDTIKNTTLWNYQSSLGFSTFNQYNVAKYCNVYVNGNLPGLCGFATYPSGTSNRQGGIFLNKSCIGAGTQTYPHEMGHYLNLPHTFEDSDGIEYVDGSNCATAGDGFCDTPADFINYRTACPYAGDSTDPNGDLYRTVVDETLFMSYFSDNCIFKFSNEEQAEMNSTLTGRRSYLLNQPLPDFTALDSAVFIRPVPGDTAVNTSGIQFLWRSIPRAVYYHLRVQSSTSSLVVIDTMMRDTSYTVSTLVANRGYKYQVTAYSFGNTCGENAAYQFIKTSSIKTIITVTPSSCAGANNAVISATATNGTNPYTFDWSNGGFGPSLDNLGPGTYSVTVMDNSGEVVIANVLISEPPALTLGITAVGNNLNANGNGGTAPYTYEWSNGVTGPFNNNIQYGSYSVTVTDAKGCSTVQTFLYSSLGVDLESTIDMKIFPNPVYRSEVVNLQVQLNEPTEVAVMLMTTEGKVIEQIERTLVSGMNELSLPTEELSSGIYFVQLRSSKGVATKRVSVIK